MMSGRRSLALLKRLFRSPSRPVRAALIAFAIAPVFSAPAAAEDVALRSTLQICRNDPGLSLAETVNRLRSVGWTDATQSATRKSIASHIAAGVHYSARGRWKDDYAQMRRSLLGIAGGKTLRNGTTTGYVNAPFLTLGDGRYMILWDDLRLQGDGTLAIHSRTCYLAVPPSIVVTAFSALGTPVKNLGIRRIKGSFVSSEGRRYWITADHKSLPTGGLPFKIASTEFIRVNAMSN